MGDLDPGRGLEIHRVEGGAVARIPLDEPEGLRLDYYGPLAQLEGLDAAAEWEPGGAVLVIRVPSGVTRDDTFRILNTAVGLVDQAKAEEIAQTGASRSAEQHVKDWWAEQGR